MNQTGATGEPTTWLSPLKVPDSAVLTWIDTNEKELVEVPTKAQAVKHDTRRKQIERMMLPR